MKEIRWFRTRPDAKQVSQSRHNLHGRLVCVSKNILTNHPAYAILYWSLKQRRYVRVAQLDRASGYGPEGRGFESSRARKENKSIRVVPGYSYFVLVQSDSNGFEVSERWRVLRSALYKRPPDV